MLWAFLILGLLTLMAVLYGLATAWLHQGRMLKLHLLALVLLGIAWAEEHTTIAGWAGLAASTVVELATWSVWLFFQKAPQRSAHVLIPRIGGPRAKMGEALTHEWPAEADGSVATEPLAAAAKAPAEADSSSEDDSVLGHGGTGSQSCGTGFHRCGTGFQPVRSPGNDAPQADSEQAVCKEDVGEAERTTEARADPPAEAAEPPGEQAADMTADATAGQAPLPSSPVEAEAAEAATDSHRLETGAAALETGTAASETSATVLDTDAAAAPQPGSADDNAMAADLQDSLDVSATTRSFKTFILLKRRCAIAAGVFLASLRRNGQRDATLAETPGADDAAWIHAGPIAIALRIFAEPCDVTTLHDALAISPDGAESAGLVAGHEAHATLTSVYSPETAPDLVVRLHHRAHAALREFAPVAAVLWPDAGRVVPAEHLPALLDQAADPDRPLAETCTQIRVFPLSEPNSGWVLTDCVGLHALGLPDVQIITPAQPDEAVVKSLHDVTERFLTCGCDLEDGATFAIGDRPPGHILHTRGAFPPDRQVVQITFKKA